MLQNEIIDFFQNVLPFDRLSREALGDMVSDIAMEYYPKGEQILKQGGPPSEFLGVIKRGGVKVYQISENDDPLPKKVGSNSYPQVRTAHFDKFFLTF